ncbi:ArnT family glycosyltransferase [Jatrophihabitans sp.]|uniref:ArnT family glycosyltransferase n=1 Tax=Jatrophihabitans sp. TaxID=1932789 RepID=UPI002BC90FD7|nr:phospholipid carrier-dependent glycosyltransferase [Jatrophihabitans sp.]
MRQTARAGAISWCANVLPALAAPSPGPAGPTAGRPTRGVGTAEPDGPPLAPTAGSGGRRPHLGTPAFLLSSSIVAAAAVFENFYRLSRAPIQVDEALYANVSWRYLHWNSLPATQRTSVLNNFEHPPLAKVLFGLAELVRGRPDIGAARAVSACCTVGTALILCLWLGAAVNRWAGLLAGGTLALIPMSVTPQVTRFGRAAMLDPVAGFFVVGSLALGWYWFRHSGWRAWVLAVAAGIGTGLASASKENGFLGLVVPVAAGLVWSRHPLTALLVRLLQALSAVVAAAGAFLCCYLPFGDPAGRIGYLYRFQSRHSRNGHTVGFDGRLASHPPWWTNLWFAGHGVGPMLSWALPLAMLAAVVLRRDRLVGWLVASLVAPLIFHCWLAGVVLPFYWTLWTPAAVALSALGCWELARLAGQVRPPGLRQRLARGTAGLAAAGALVAIVVPSVGQLDRVARLPRDGPVALPGIRARLGLHGAVLTTGFQRIEVATFTGTAPVYLRLPKDFQGIDTVLIGQPRCHTVSDPVVRAFVVTNLRSGSLRLVRTDRLARLYLASGPLQAPTADEIRAQPVVQLVTGC